MADGQLDKLHDLVAGKLAGVKAMADFDTECGTAGGPTSWTRDRVQYAVSRAMSQDPVFAQKARSLMELLGATDRPAVPSGAADWRPEPGFRLHEA